MFKQESEEEEGDQNMPPPAMKESATKRSVKQSQMEDEDEDQDGPVFQVYDVESEGDQNMPGQVKLKESTMFEVNDESMDGTMFQRGEEEEEGDQRINTAPPQAKKAPSGLKLPGGKAEEAETESFQSVHDELHSQKSSVQAPSARSSAAASKRS
jgi:hypothetical protein